MTILWAESFEHYGTTAEMLDGLWANVNLVGSSFVGDAATGLKCFRVPLLGNARRYLGDDYTRAGISFNFKVDGMPLSAIHSFGLMGLRTDVGSQVVNLRLTSAGRIQLILGPLGSDVIAATTSKLAVSAGVWNHCEFIADATANTVEVWLNGKLAIDYAGAVNGPFAEASFGVYNTGNANLFSPTNYDNIVAQGGDDTAQLGQVGVYYLQPIADVDPQEWALTTGAQAWALVDDLSPDDDSEYIFTGDADRTASFEVEALPLNVNNVVAVIPIARVRKTDTGDCESVLGVVSGGIAGESVDGMPALLDYSYQFTVFETDPEDDAGWAPAPMPNIFIRRTV